MIKAEILNSNNEVLLSKSGEEELYLVYKAEYQEGDYISLTTDRPGLYEVKLDAALDVAPLYLNGAFTFPIPFNEKKDCYPQIAFSAPLNLITVRALKEKAAHNYKNLVFNPYDHHENTALFPHSYANVETRGESVFASRNAMDGNFASDLHGKWPYESWGINRNPDATMSVDFGRKVKIDTIVFYTRADFPHDAWWTEATITFDSGEKKTFPLEKKDGAQSFKIDEVEVSAFTISNLIKADDPSPFPALIQIEAWGCEA